MDADIFVPYVLNPRVDDEVLQKYRKAILEQLSEEEKNMLSQWNLLTPAQRAAVINIIGLLLSSD